MNRATTTLTDRVKNAVVSELDRHRPEIESTDSDISEIHVTVKMKNKIVRKVLYSRTTERELE